jgi:hypothetical protein
MIILLYLFGKEINGNVICSGLIKKGLRDNICNGVLSNTHYDIIQVAKKYGYFLGYSLSFLLGLIPFSLFLKYSSKVITIKRFLIVFLFLFLFSLPLFVLAVDCGRWISIHFVLLLFTSTILLENRSHNRFAFFETDWRIPNLFGSKNILCELSGKIIFVLIAFFYLSTWKMAHCFYPFYILKPTAHFHNLFHLLHGF